MTFSIRELVFELGVLFLNLLVWRFIRPKGKRARFAVRCLLFTILCYALWAVNISPLSLPSFANEPLRHFLAQVLSVLWWLQLAQICSATLGTHLLPPILQGDRIFQDVLHAAIFLLAGFLAVAHVFNMPIGGLIATSGAIAIIFGLAVQSTLSDAFSGVVLRTTRPFRAGDNVVIGDVRGQVVEANWRAMTFLNSRGNYVVIPNSTIAKALITNESRPPHMHGVAVSVQVASGVRPALVLAALEDAMRGTPGLSDHPKPTASAQSMGYQFVEYEVLAYVDTEQSKRAARNELIDQVHRQLAARGIDMRFDAIIGGGQKFEQLLRGVEMFLALSDEQISDLARTMTKESYEPGQLIYEVGENCPEEGRALLIIASGVASSLAPDKERDIEVRRLTPGDAIGRMGLLTGVSTPIKLRAVSRVVAARLRKDALTPILREHPAIGKQMLDTLLSQQAKGAEIVSEIPVSGDDREGLIHRLLDGMRRMHDILR